MEVGLFPVYWETGMNLRDIREVGKNGKFREGIFEKQMLYMFLVIACTN